MGTSHRLGVLAIGGALVLAGCGLTSDDADEEPDGQSLIVATDLPLQGPAAPASQATNNMIELYLEQQGNRAGIHTVAITAYDESDAEDGSWSTATCARNAQAHVATENEIAVMGPLHSGCAKVIVPVLNQDPRGPMLAVSHSNTNPGLTQGWDPGEPEIFYPTGERNYARVVTTDEQQGAAAAQFLARKAKAATCYVIHDDQTYGRGVAKAFVDEAPSREIEILGNEAWDPEASDYQEMFEQIQALDPDCLYVAGNYESNGSQLFQDKVEYLGDNDEVPTMAPDGFTGFPEFRDLPEAEGVYLSFPGLDQETLVAEGGMPAALARAYEERYGEPPASTEAFYGVAAMQVILAAIEQSDGTRAGVTEAVFGDEGITIPARESALGRKLTIDAETGDVGRKEVTLLQLLDGQESVVETWSPK